MCVIGLQTPQDRLQGAHTRFRSKKLMNFETEKKQRTEIEKRSKGNKIVW